MTTDITELAQRLKSAAEKATPGEWVYFPKNTSIEYDVGSDESQGSILYVDSGDFTQAQTDRNGEFIALANPNNVLALVEALEKAQRANGYLREQSAEWERKAISNFEDCAEMSARVEELESQRKLSFTASNRWADKFREAEKRIAELESRTVKLPKLKMLEDYFAEVAIEERKQILFGVKLEFHRELTAAGIKVEAE
ncbi:ead/Ea22-like family protein [Klebsiella pneumoniae]|uniref:ead/Ea22-like family protein n=1 Tax=Klebsiella pneumoniae TaxID=573 RepID=UPI001919CD7F|nr:ead/Ea22-like family protein [Klebsiella pneumoniae]